MSSEAQQLIHVSAVVLRNASGHVVTVRKAGIGGFLFPGGKLEPGESAAEAALHECAEDTGIELAAEGLRKIGVFRCLAANEPG